MKLPQCLPLLVAACLAGTAVAAHAAAPDGATGPWADAVRSSVQGASIDGSPVAPIRSDPEQAVGPGEASLADGNFFSLGVGGDLVLAFDNPVCDAAGTDLRVLESTRGPYVPESAQVDVSPDGITWTPAARALQGTYRVELPDGVDVRFVRLVDTTTPTSKANYDGFDVNGIQALHSTGPCAPGTDGDDPTLALPPANNPENAAAGLLGQSASGGGLVQGVIQGVCGSKRRIKIRLRVPERLGKRLASATLTASRGVKTSKVRFRRHRYRATIDLGGLKKARYRLRIKMVGKNGEVAKSSRRYRACTSGATYKAKHPKR